MQAKAIASDHSLGVQGFPPASFAMEGAASAGWTRGSFAHGPCSACLLGLCCPGIAFGWTWRSLHRFMEWSLVLTAHQRALSPHGGPLRLCQRGPATPMAASSTQVSGPSPAEGQVEAAARTAGSLLGWLSSSAGWRWDQLMHCPTCRHPPCLLPAPGPALHASVTESHSPTGTGVPRTTWGVPTQQSHTSCTNWALDSHQGVPWLGLCLQDTLSKGRCVRR